MKTTKQSFSKSNTSQQPRHVNSGWARTATKYMLFVALISLPQITLAYKIKIQNDLDVILVFDEILNRQAVKVKSKPMVILSGDEGIVKVVGNAGSLKSDHLKIRYIVGQSGSPMSITFGNNKGKCYVNSSDTEVTVSIDYNKSEHCGSGSIHIMVSGKVADILDNL